MSDFMKPEFSLNPYYEIETEQGTSFVPEDVQSVSPERLTALEQAATIEDQWAYQQLAKPFADFVIGETIQNITYHAKGCLARLSAPGYLDATDWMAYDNELEALIALVDENEFEFETMRGLLCYLDDFVHGYWQGTGFANASLESSEDAPYEKPLFPCQGEFDDAWDVEDEIEDIISDDDRASVRSDCVGMYLDCLKTLGRDFEDAHEAERAGTDFVFSRNGHGAGFFDGDWGSHGGELQRAAKVYGAHSMIGTRDDDGDLVSIYFHS